MYTRMRSTNLVWVFNNKNKKESGFNFYAFFVYVLSFLECLPQEEQEERL